MALELLLSMKFNCQEICIINDKKHTINYTYHYIINVHAFEVKLTIQKNNWCCIPAAMHLLSLLQLFTLHLEKLVYICISFLLWAVISLTAVLFICTICTVYVLITYKLWIDIKQLITTCTLCLIRHILTVHHTITYS